MYIFKVNTGSDGTLTYLFQENSWDKSGDDHLGGISNFINAFKKLYENHPEPARMTVMRDNGLYYNPKTKAFVYSCYFRDIKINLNSLAEKEE